MAKRATLSLPGAKAHYSATNLDTNFNAVNNNFDNYLHLGGVGESSNSMTGNLDLDGNFIVNVGTPSLSHHVATKAYVDQKLTVVSSGTSVTSIIEDADNDTGVDSEASSDLDRVDIFAGTSGGADTGLQLIGDDSSASALTNPYLKFLKHVVLDTGVRIGDAASADTYLELNRSGSTNHIYLNAGGNSVLELDSTSVLVYQDILLYDNAAAAEGVRIGDEDGDTYIVFNEATGGTDDDTIRFYVGGSEGLNISSGGLSAVTSIQLDNLAVGIALPGSSEDNNIIMTTGTANTASNMDDNTVAIYTAVSSGIQNDLQIDVKTGASTKATVILGEDCTFPNDVTITGDLTISGTTASSSKDTGALVIEGGLGVEEDVYVGGQIVVTGNLDVDGTASIDAMAADHWPSFSAYLSSPQAVAATTEATIVFNVERFDTNSDYNASTGIFTPTIPGKYLVMFSVHCDSVTSGDGIGAKIFKNTSTQEFTPLKETEDTSTEVHGVGMSIVDMNGTTDTLKIVVDSGSDSSYNVSGFSSTSLTTFSASRIA